MMELRLLRMALGVALLFLTACGNDHDLDTPALVQRFGKTLVAEYHFTPAMLQRYFAEGISDPAIAGRELLSGGKGHWNGPTVNAAYYEPLVLVLRLHGRALSKGDVTAGWKTYWGSGAPAPGPYVKRRNAKQGEAIDVAIASFPEHASRPATLYPHLALDELSNIEIESMDIIIVRGESGRSAKDIFRWVAVSVLVGLGLLTGLRRFKVQR